MLSPLELDLHEATVALAVDLLTCLYPVLATTRLVAFAVAFAPVH